MLYEGLANGGMCMAGICGNRRRTEIDPAVARLVENLKPLRPVPENGGLIAVYLRKKLCSGLHVLDAFGDGQGSHDTTMRRLNSRRLFRLVDKSIC